MVIKIIIDNQAICIRLYNGKKLTDQVSFHQDQNMSEKMLPAIDRILKKNNLNSKRVKRIDLESNLAESYTSYRIAKATVDAFNYAIRCG